jgi:hypothetical protein
MGHKEDGMEYSYHIDGRVNGRPVMGKGKGTTNPATGVSEMEVFFRRLPDGWDPRMIVLLCCDRSTVMAAREEGGAVGMHRAAGSYPSIDTPLINGFHWGLIRDMGGQTRADVWASSETGLRGKETFDYSHIEGSVTYLRPRVNGISAVHPFVGVMMQAGPYLVTVTTKYEAMLEDGSSVYGITYHLHFLPQQAVQLPSVQLLTMSAVQQEFDGEHLWVKTTSHVTPMVEMPTGAAPESAAAAV